MKSTTVKEVKKNPISDKVKRFRIRGISLEQGSRAVWYEVGVFKARNKDEAIEKARKYYRDPFVFMGLNLEVTEIREPDWA